MKHHMHGDTGTRLYRIWKSMKCRCTNELHPTYPRYGGRGITVCDEWVENYPAFKRWALTHGYDEDLELDRINVDMGYDPMNCRWISHHEQTLNRSDTLYLIMGGNLIRFADFCKEHGLNRHTVTGWRSQGILDTRLTELFNTPVQVKQWREVMRK